VGTDEWVKTVITPPSGVDPTPFAVEFAIVADETEPSDSDWHTGEWAVEKGLYVAKAHLGPGTDFDLDPGKYDMHVRIAAGSTRPRRKFDTLVLF
jgi:hypothetical protein